MTSHQHQVFIVFSATISMLTHCTMIMNRVNIIQYLLNISVLAMSLREC